MQENQSCFTFAAILALGACLSAQQVFRTYPSDLQVLGNSWMGSAIENAGDVNRDGYPDLIVGAPFDGTRLKLGGAVWVYSGKDGAILYQFFGARALDNLGHSVSAGDVDNDGFPDLIVGVPVEVNTLSALWLGAVHVYSGKDGKLLYTVRGGVKGDRFGFSVSSIGDLDGDNCTDFVVGAPYASGGSKGSFRVVSGKTGKTLFSQNGGAYLGHHVSRAMDVDRDGVPDFIVGYPRDTKNAPLSGSATVYSGRTFKSLWTVYASKPKEYLGSPVAAAMDINLDGHPDFIISSGGTNGTPAAALVYSGKDGKVMHTFRGPPSAYGAPSANSAGDFDGDGYPDVVVGTPYAYNPQVKVYSGRDGRELAKLSRRSSTAFGRAVGNAGDVNKDGREDLYIGAPHTSYRGRVLLVSGKRLAFWSDRHELSLKRAGKQTQHLDAGTAHGGRTYWVLGSLTGTAPGVNLGSTHIPLNLDLYTHFTINLANSSVLGSSRGTLDAAGKASASFNVPTGVPPIPGFTLYHAFVVLDKLGRPTMASNPVPLRLVY